MAEYTYPLNLDLATQAQIRFHTYKAQPIDVSSYEALQTGFSGLIGENVGERLVNGIEQFVRELSISDLANKLLEKAESTESLSAEEKDAAMKKLNDQKADSTKKILEGLQGFRYKLDTKSPVVNMFVPLSLQYNDNIIYDNAQLGAAGAAFGRALQEGNGLLSSLGQGILDGFSTAGDVIANGLGGLAETSAARLALQRTVQMASSRIAPGIANTTTLALQTSLNPNTRGLFRGVALREFSFSFNMIPRNAKESKEVEAIVEYFRQRMYPSAYNPIDETSSLPIAYDFPDLFRISFKLGKTNIKVPRIHLCYLRNCQVAYNPTGSTFHEDGQPNEVTMTLQFMEHKTLTRQEIGRQSDERSIGATAMEEHRAQYGSDISRTGY